MKHRSKKLAAALGAAFTLPAAALADGSAGLEAPTVEVIGTTPLPGLGVPADQVPAPVQAVTGADLRERQAVNLPDFMSRELPSVNVNEITGNPYQADLNYRGFTASPLLGTPQGLSVFQDGVRVNSPFGDTVLWDLIPQQAISSINLVPGSNPVFGLNTLGGALGIRTKSGRYFPNTGVEAMGGSWGRWQVAGEHGGHSGDKDWYLSASHFEEDGWRDFSPSEVTQLFGKVGYEDARTDLDLSLTFADTDLTGNGVLPESMMNQRRDQVFTVPDNTTHELFMVNLTGSHALSDTRILQGNLYYRTNKTDTLNGDANDDFEDSANDGATGANGGLGFNADTAVNNRTRTDEDGYGGTLQMAFIGERHQLTAGASYDYGRSEFEQSSAEGIFDDIRAVTETDDNELEDSLKGTTRTWSLFVTDTWELRPSTHLTLSARYNHTQVETEDRINPNPPNLDNDYTYKRLNPAIGLTHQFDPALTVYGGWNQGSRAPSPIELGCSDPANPCTLPNALAADPFLNQVIAQTFELGTRGRLAGNWRWNAGAWSTTNKDDILFVSTGTSAGYFTNYGRTRRRGLELGLGGSLGTLGITANYAYVDATFRSEACLLAENNSSAGSDPACGADDIRVKSGNRIPGIPRHQFKLALDWRPAERWSLGVDLAAFSDQYARGNENNQHEADGADFLGSGKVDGYAVVNLTARFRPTKEWEVFARVDNVFDTDYETGAILAENPFDSAGRFQTNSDDWTGETFFAPGAPRAAWVGVRFLLEREPRR